MSEKSTPFNWILSRNHTRLRNMCRTYHEKREKKILVSTTTT